MFKNKREVFCISVATILMLGFQNCTYLHNSPAYSSALSSDSSSQNNSNQADFIEVRSPSSASVEKPTFFFQHNNSPYFKAL